MSTLILFDFVSYCFALGFFENHAISGEILWFKIKSSQEAKNFIPPCFQVLPWPKLPPYCVAKKQQGILSPDKVSATNQHTYNNITSFVLVELDCIQFDYVRIVGSNAGPM